MYEEIVSWAKSVTLNQYNLDFHPEDKLQFELDLMVREEIGVFMDEDVIMDDS